jgi:predicted RNA binding protein YcfA (HicA-like mRNA interferase family)
VIRILERLDFELGCSSGSHRIYKNKENRRVTVPYHFANAIPGAISNSGRVGNLRMAETVDKCPHRRTKSICEAR